MDPSADERRQARLARNEHMFRTVNESIASSAQGLPGADDHRYDFMCECADTECGAMIQLTTSEYATLRERGEHFAVVPGHEVPDVEFVVERHDGYWVVEKVEHGKQVARDLAGSSPSP